MPKSKSEKPPEKEEKAIPAKKAGAKVAMEEAVQPVAKSPVAEKKKKMADPRTSSSVFTTSNADSGSMGKSPFMDKQRERLLHLRDNILDSMNGVAKDTLRSRAEGSEASAFGMHQADAGSDAYDRDFALSLLSQEQDALYEIEEALKRIEHETYGICEMSGKPIAHARLEAIPFARYTVECQAQIEKTNKVQRSRAPVTSLFGLTEGEEPAESEEEEAPTDTKE